MFYSGFALQDESDFFKEFIDATPYVISGFSYGAIQAFEAALKSQKRVDKLQLFSPAFFQNRSSKFKRLQMMGYQKNSDMYIQKFTKNCFLPYEERTVTYGKHSAEDLELLLNYEWRDEALEALTDRGTKVEVYLGGEDKISDVSAAYTFFVKHARVMLIKKANHFLQGA